MIAMKATVIATMILASLLLLAVPVAAEVGSGDMVQADVAPLDKPTPPPPTPPPQPWGPGTGSGLMPYKWLPPKENYRCGDVEVPAGSYQVYLDGGKTKIDDPSSAGSYPIYANGVQVGTVTLRYDDTSDMYVLDWKVEDGTFTGDIAVKGGPGSFVYGYTGSGGDTGLYPPRNPGGKWPEISHFVICGYFTPDEEESEYCGLTLGYWKNHPDAWPDGYTPGQTVGSVFSEATDATKDATLMNALNFGGGPGLDGAERILLKQAVAAVLNEAEFGERYQGSGIIGQVNGAISSKDRATMIALAEQLDTWNNAGECS